MDVVVVNTTLRSPGYDGLDASRASKVLREEVTRLKRQEFCCKLTTTEKEVLQLIGLGYSQSKTIQLMGISPNTMKTHIRHFFFESVLVTGQELFA